MVTANYTRVTNSAFNYSRSGYKPFRLGNGGSLLYNTITRKGKNAK